MKKVIWGSVPPKSEKLNSGLTRVFLTYTEKTRTSKVKEEEKEVEITEYEVIYADVKNPEDKAEIIRALVSQKYQIQDEIAILRQKDSKPEEYTEYNNYVENCKSLVKEWLQK